MVKKTRTMVATIIEGKKHLNKNKKPRTSTIDQTIASSKSGFKTQKKATKTRTMVETLKAASALPKTKKVAKKATKGKKGKKGGKKVLHSKRTKK